MTPTSRVERLLSHLEQRAREKHRGECFVLVSHAGYQVGFGTPEAHSNLKVHPTMERALVAVLVKEIGR